MACRAASGNSEAVEQYWVSKGVKTRRKRYPTYLESSSIDNSQVEREGKDQAISISHTTTLLSHFGTASADFSLTAAH